MVEELKNDIRILDNFFLEFYNKNKQYPITSKISLEDLNYHKDFPKFMMQETGDDLSQMYKLDFITIKNNKVIIKNNINHFYYSAKSKQIVYPEGVEGKDGIYTFNDYPHVTIDREIEYPEPPKPVPEPPKPDTSKTSIKGGWNHSLILKEGVVYEAGLNGSEKFTQVKDLPTNITKIYTQYYVNLAIDKNGTVFVWENGGAVKQVTDIPEIKEIFVKFDEVYFLTTTNNILNLKLDTLSCKYIDITNVKKVAIEKDFTLFLDYSGNVYSMGRNDYGQLGLGHTREVDRPQKILTLPFIKDIFVGRGSSYFLSSNNEVYSCGKNDYGQLGLGYSSKETMDRDCSPKKITTLQGVRKVIPNETLSGPPKVFAITNDNFLYGWGMNFKDDRIYLGFQGTDTITEPTKYEDIKNVDDVISIQEQTFALTKEKEVYSWGYQKFNGVLGLGEGVMSIPNPTLINDLSNIIAFEAGPQHMLTLDDMNNIYVWGDNSNSQLGIGNKTTKFKPVRIIEPIKK